MTQPEKHGIETFAQILIVRFLAAMIGLGTASWIGSMYYTDLEGVSRPDQVMDARPDAPGTEDVMWKKHEAKCWRFEPKGQVDAVIIRVRPNDPFVYTTKPRLMERAIDQATKDTNRGLDRILAFCTNHITQKGR